MFILYKNVKSICVAIIFGFPHSLIGPYVLLLFVPHTPSSGTSVGRCFVIGAFPGYLHLYFGKDLSSGLLLRVFTICV